MRSSPLSTLMSLALLMVLMLRPAPLSARPSAQPSPPAPRADAPGLSHASAPARPEHRKVFGPKAGPLGPGAGCPVLVAAYRPEPPAPQRESVISCFACPCCGLLATLFLVLLLLLGGLPRGRRRRWLPVPFLYHGFGGYAGYGRSGAYGGGPFRGGFGGFGGGMPGGFGHFSGRAGGRW